MFFKLSKQTPKQVLSLSEEEKIITEEYLDDGCKATEIKEKTGYDLILIRRHVDLLRKRKERKGEQAGGEYQHILSELRVEKVKHELEILKEKNGLELEEKKLDIEEKRAELNGEYDELPSFEGEEMPGIFTFLTTLLNKQNTKPSEANAPNSSVIAATGGNTASQTRDLSEQEIQKLLDDVKANNPHYITLMRTLPDSQVYDYLKRNYSFSDTTIKKAMEMVRNAQVQK